MTSDATRINIVRSVFELLGVVLMRFGPIQRIWGAWLVAVNAAAVLFITHVEAQVTLGAVGLALLSQGLIYQRKRFIRLLGATHIVWIPMLAWIAMRLGTVPEGEITFQLWLLALIATNAVSLVVDTWDAIRFVLGERQPYYAW